MKAHPEALLISSMIRTGDFVIVVSGGIDRSHFHQYPIEWKWLARYIKKHRKTPSRSTFQSKFPEFKVHKVHDTEHLIEEVKKEHARFMMIEILDQAADGLGTDDVEKTLKSLTSQFNTLSYEMESSGNEIDIVAGWRDTYEEARRRAELASKGGMSGIPTGFTSLDLFTGGPGPGELWIVAARLGQGKTWTMIRMACTAFAAGHTVQYDTLEQTKSQIAMRAHAFMSSESGKETFRTMDLMQGKNYDLRAYKKFLYEFSKNRGDNNFFVSDTSRGRVNVQTIAAQIERNQPSIVFVDYLTLMDTGDDWHGVAQLSADLKQLAQRYEIPIVAASQINRMGEGKEPPRAVHLSQADAIGHDADAVVTHKQQSTHVQKFRLAKYRNGQDGQTWYAMFNPNNGKYAEVTGDEANDIIDQDLQDSED